MVPQGVGKEFINGRCRLYACDFRKSSWGAKGATATDYSYFNASAGAVNHETNQGAFW